MREQVEERLKFYESGEAPRKNVDVMKEAISEVSASLTSEKKKKKKRKKEKNELNETNNEENTLTTTEDVIEEETPSSSGKKKRKKKKSIGDLSEIPRIEKHRMYMIIEVSQRKLFQKN